MVSIRVTLGSAVAALRPDLRSFTASMGTELTHGKCGNIIGPLCSCYAWPFAPSMLVLRSSTTCRSTHSHTVRTTLHTLNGAPLRALFFGRTSHGHLRLLKLSNSWSSSYNVSLLCIPLQDTRTNSPDLQPPRLQAVSRRRGACQSIHRDVSVRTSPTCSQASNSNPTTVLLSIQSQDFVTTLQLTQSM